MAWTCPACRTQVQHSTELPRPNRVYRCPVCRLHMTFDEQVKKMTPVAPNGDNGGEKKRKVA